MTVGVHVYSLKKVSLKMLNSVGNNSFTDLVSVYLMVFDH